MGQDGFGLGCGWRKENQMKQPMRRYELGGGIIIFDEKLE